MAKVMHLSRVGGDTQVSNKLTKNETIGGPIPPAEFGIKGPDFVGYYSGNPRIKVN